MGGLWSRGPGDSRDHDVVEPKGVLATGSVGCMGCEVLKVQNRPRFPVTVPA